MKHLLVQCNPNNGWLDSSINVYDQIDGYTIKRPSKKLSELSSSDIFTDFQNIVSYFLNLSKDEWDMTQIKCFREGEYHIYERQTTEEEIEMIDADGNATTETVSVTRDVIIDTIPIIVLRLKDTSIVLKNNSERFYFVKSTELDKNIETSITKIWKSFFGI